MKIYIAASLVARADMAILAEAIRSAGHEVVSTWHDGELTAADEVYLTAQSGESKRLAGQEINRKCLHELAQADTLAKVTLWASTSGMTHFEAGCAWGRCKLILIGPEKTPCDCAGRWEKYENIDAFLIALQEDAKHTFDTSGD